MFDRSAISIVIFTTALVLALTKSVAADTAIGQSIEWQVAEADLIARCRPPEITEEVWTEPNEEDSLIYSQWRADFEVKSVLKGDETKVITVSIGNRKALDEWRSIGDERIVFFEKSDSGNVGRWDALLLNPTLHPFRLAPHCFCISSRKETLNQPLAYTSDLRVLRSIDEIEDAIRVAVVESKPIAPAIVPKFLYNHLTLNKSKRGDRFAVRISVPGNSPVHAELWGRSQVFLEVPLDERSEQLALEWSTYPNRLEQSVQILRWIKSKRSIAFFQSLLNDNSHNPSTSNGPGTVWRYWIREIAYNTLVAWGVDVPRPAIDMPDDGYIQLGLWNAIAAATSLLLMISLVSRLIRRKKNAANRSYAISMFDAFCIAGLVLSCSLGLWFGKPRIILEATVSRGETRYWTWIKDGKLCFSKAEHWPQPISFSIAAFDRNNCPPYRWNQPWNNSPPVPDRMGFRVTRSSIRSNIHTRNYIGPGVSLPYYQLETPLWAVIILIGGVPLLRLGLAGRQVVQQRQRDRLGQCRKCGYDLRAGHERCPECGSHPA